MNRTVQTTQVMLSSKTNEYKTPPYIMTSARAVLGKIDLDPASTDEANKIVKANKIYTIEDNGLRFPWLGRVWLNPPYGKSGKHSNQERWLRYLIYQYQVGNTRSAIVLTRAAVGYNWFSDLWYDWTICITDRCLRFVRAGEDEPKKRSKTATTFWYFGTSIRIFIHEFRQYGRIILPERT